VDEKLHRLKPKPDSSDAFQTPPPAKPAPGVSGGMPMPPGEIVKASIGYTDEELSTLKTLPGWTPDKGVPSNLPEMLEQARLAQKQTTEDMDPDNLQAPVPADTPALVIPTPVDFNKLPPEEQERLRASIETAHEQSERRRQQAKSVVKNMAPGASGVNEAISGHNVRSIDLSDDTQADTYAGTDIPKAPQEEQPAESRTGVSDEPLLRNCPHCNWNLKQPDVPDPDKADRQRYLQSVLGLRTFQKHYSLMGGQLHLVFRELKPAEIDLVFKQAGIDRRNGVIETNADFFEVLQRLRLCLQLVELRTPEINHRFPESVEKWAEGQPVETPTSTILPNIYESIYTGVIVTESLNATVGKALMRFNRLLAKMEANTENENFWSTTEQAS